MVSIMPPVMSAAMMNNPFNEYHKVKKAQFYLFECIDNQEVANMLFQAVFDWAHEHGQRFSGLYPEHRLLFHPDDLWKPLRRSQRDEKVSDPLFDRRVRPHP